MSLREHFYHRSFSDGYPKVDILISEEMPVKYAARNFFLIHYVVIIMVA